MVALKIIPSVTATLVKNKRKITTQSITDKKGYWDNSNPLKKPIGGCNFRLPPADIHNIEVDIVMTYSAQMAGGIINPQKPISVSHKFTIKTETRA